MIDISIDDLVLLDNGDEGWVTDIPEGNEDAPEDLFLYSTDNENLRVANRFQVVRNHTVEARNAA